MTLYGYWRSTTSYRVRIALHLKGVPYDTVSVDLATGAQRSEAYLALNPGGGVPCLRLDDGTVLTQSMAILDYLNAVYPDPPLMPIDPVAAARMRAAAMIIASDIHPVNNLKVLRAFQALGHGPDTAADWVNDWSLRGLQAYAALLPKGTRFSFGDRPMLADLCLIPQLYNAHRWGTDLSALARLTDIETQCLALPAFDAARPEAQADAA